MAKTALSISLLGLTVVPITYNSILTTLSVQAATAAPTFTDTQAITYSIDLKNITATASTYAGASGVALVIPDSISYDGVVYPVVAIGASAFLNTGISSVVIGDNVTDIGTSAFQTTTASSAFYKSALKNVTLGKNVQNIKTDAFAGNAISQIQFPSSLVKLGARAFANNFLTNLLFGSNITDIASKAFQTNNLSTITFAADSSATVGSLAFSGSPIEKISLGAGVVWADDALNKISPLFGQLIDMPSSGVRIAIESQGVIKKSWLGEISVVDEKDNSAAFEENISEKIELPKEDTEAKEDESNIGDLHASEHLQETVEEGLTDSAVATEVVETTVSEELELERDLVEEEKEDESLPNSDEIERVALSETENKSENLVNQSALGGKSDENTNLLEKNTPFVTALQVTSGNTFDENKKHSFLTGRNSSNQALPALGEKTVSMLLLAVTMLVGISIGYLLPKVKK